MIDRGGVEDRCQASSNSMTVSLLLYTLQYDYKAVKVNFLYHDSKTSKHFNMGTKQYMMECYVYSAGQISH